MTKAERDKALKDLESEEVSDFVLVVLMELVDDCEKLEAENERLRKYADWLRGIVDGFDAMERGWNEYKAGKEEAKP